jgi:3-oxo-5alpha-steroid 4-dehydrogenase
MNQKESKDASVPNGVVWDAETDVVVVGFGGAGGCAAIEAAEQGASVMVLERFTGGGATAMSGGVLYAGGGTQHQRDAGFEDTPEEMFAYLKKEARGVVSDETLRRFCEGSDADLRWLEAMGVEFEGSYCPFKTSYPTDDYYLYYSGSETVEPYRSLAKPAPRGHRVKGSFLSGASLFKKIRNRVHELGIKVRDQARVNSLVVDDSGAVIGVECQAISDGTFWSSVHALLYRIHCKTIIYVPPIGRIVSRLMVNVERRAAKPLRIRARKGVVLASGGFIMNREMIAQHAPHSLAGLPLGTAGDDGSGIEFGMRVGGATDRMNRVTAWRFYNPPEGFVCGVLVDQQGQRICNEALYGAAVGSKMIEEHGGKAYLILDAATWRSSIRQVFNQTVFFQKMQVFYIFLAGHKRASTLANLARKTGIDAEALQQTMSTYNEMARNGQPDPEGKPNDYLQPLEQSPYYAVNCSLDTPHAFPCPVLTLGGLVVDEVSGMVKREDESLIEGLYAVGRTAVGICSESYVSGLSIADCVFSGRRAAKHAATK